MSGSNPGWINGFQPTPAQWNAEWALKADYTQTFPIPQNLPNPINGTIILPFAESGNIFYQGVLSSNVIFDLSGGLAGQQIVLVTQQSSSGGNSISFGSTILWSGGATPSPVVIANAVNAFVFYATGVSGVYIGFYLGSGGNSPTITSWQPFPSAISGVITLPFPIVGNCAYYGTISANMTFAISGGNPSFVQEMRIAITENSTGGFTIGLPGGSTVLWPQNMTPIPATSANARNIFKITTTTTANVYDGSY